ncbi:hypothetical protein [Phenylobacterium sp.]|uniref:hypothetical protein n=1 Tax=Phenylobacterium sp. TaxID=1871053 RepID=UPI00301DAE94
MGLEQVSIGEFVAAAAGPPRFRAKHMPTQTVSQELHTEVSRLIALFCIADDTDTFILNNRWVGGDIWSQELADYTDPIWETVVLRSSAKTFEAIPTGPDSVCRMEWAGGFVQWNAVAVEPFTYLGEPVTFGVGGALAYATAVDGRPHELLVELELPSRLGEWRLRRSPTPSAFVLARHAVTS